MPNGDTVTYQLDQNGNRTRLIWPDGYYAAYVYDQLNRLTTISLNGSTSASVSCEYDELSRGTQMSYENGCVTNYAYALNNDLTSLQHLFVGSEVTFQFACNNVHQLVGMSVDDNAFLWEPSSSSTVTYAIANDLNQYPSVGGTDYSYSGNGCLTGGPQSATFDSLNGVTRIVSGSTTNNYWTDPLNRQARKSVNGTDTNYLYNGQQLIATYNDSGTLLSRFIPGLGLDAHFIDITGSDNVYLHTDRIGSVIAETNASGAVLNKFTYSPFGETSSISASNFGYTGQRYDSEIGLYNYKARYYSPSIGRFLQPDPLGYAAGDLNLYSYVGNDGLNSADPMGLEPGLGNGGNSAGALVMSSAVTPSEIDEAINSLNPPALQQGKQIMDFTNNWISQATQNQQRLDLPGAFGGNLTNLSQSAAWLQQQASNISGGLIPPPSGPITTCQSCNQQAQGLFNALIAQFQNSNGGYNPTFNNWTFTTQTAPLDTHSWVQASNGATVLTLDPWQGVVDYRANTPSFIADQINQLPIWQKK